MDFSLVCRTCLGTKYLNPISKEGDDYDGFSATVFMTTGLKIEINDGLPQQICKNCLKFLKDALKFRQLCKDTELQLLTIKSGQENQKNELKNIKIQKHNLRRRKPKDVNSNGGLIKVKIEPSFRNDDDIPLLLKQLYFTNFTVSKRKNLKVGTEFIKIDDINQETNDEFVENDKNDQQIHSKLIDRKTNDENKQEIEIEFVHYEDIGKDVHALDNQYAKEEKTARNGLKADNNNEHVKTDLEILESEEAKYETEFLDLQFESDVDNDLTTEMEMTNYNMEIPKYDTKFSEYKKEIPNNDMELPKDIVVTNETEVPEYNMDCPNNVMEKSNYDVKTFINNTEYQMVTKIKKRKLKHKKITKDLHTLEKQQKYSENITENSKIKIYKQNKDISRPLLKKTDIKENPHTEENSQNNDKSIALIQNGDTNETESENMPYVIHKTNRVKCQLCQKDLSFRSMHTHMSNCHPGADGRKVKCELCDKYLMKERLTRHKLLKHGQNCFNCRYCKTEYGSKEELLEHISTCNTKKRKRKAVADKRKELIVECDVCNKSMQKASLRLHKEVKHAGMGPICEHCGRRFGNKFRLNEHLRAKHGYEKYKCSMCDFLSASRRAIGDHERRHRGEKPYECEQCGASFHAAHLLAQHRQSHRTEKIMKCDKCPAAFKANNTLHMHKITCHSNNTYQCPMCPRTYRARSYAVKHLRTAHTHTGAVGDLRLAP